MKSLLIDVLLVALGGGIGGIGRFWVSAAVARRFGEEFPWGTLVVNASGSACIGVVGGLLLAGDALAADLRPVWPGLVVGILGSYTTVSSFSLQTLMLLRTGEPLRAALNVIGSVTLCLAAAAAGYAAMLAVR